ncbi:hypothetical protein Tco_1358584 [Tanacetum coccineum]
MLGAAGVQTPENNLDNLQSLREEDGTSEIIPEVGVTTGAIVVSLGGTALVEIAQIDSNLAFLTECVTSVLLTGFDLLALVVDFTPVEVNKGLLESLVLRESVCLTILLKDVTGSTNLTLLSLFIGVTTTNFSLGFGELGHV